MCVGRWIALRASCAFARNPSPLSPNPQLSPSHSQRHSGVKDLRTKYALGHKVGPPHPTPLQCILYWRGAVKAHVRRRARMNWFRPFAHNILGSLRLWLLGLQEHRGRSHALVRRFCPPAPSPKMMFWLYLRIRLSLQPLAKLLGYRPRPPQGVEHAMGL